MVLVGSSFGSSGIFWCFVRVWLSVILYSAAGCYPCVRDASLATPFEGLYFVYFLTIQDCHRHRDGAFLPSAAAAEASVQ